MASISGVRAACEYCHRRKIRCIVPLKSASCHNCTATGILCYFAPRMKSGRPRRSTSHTIASSNSGRSTPSVQTDDGLDTSNFNVGRFDLPSQILLPLDGSQWSRYTTPEYHPTPPSNSSPVPGALSIAPLPDNSFNDGSISLSHEESIESLDFETTLQLCSDIDHRSRLLREFPSITDAEAHVQALDAACQASITIQANSDSASQSMVLAVLYKALEICHVLVQACSAGGTDLYHTASLRRLLLLRRIDTVIMFFKICFERMGSGHASGVTKAEDLHTAIERLQRLNYGNVAW